MYILDFITSTLIGPTRKRTDDYGVDRGTKSPAMNWTGVYGFFFFFTYPRAILHDSDSSNHVGTGQMRMAGLTSAPLVFFLLFSVSLCL